MPSYLIAGGTKGIGKAFTKSVLATDNEVTLLARNASDDPDLVSEKLTFLETDFSDTASIDETSKKLAHANFNYILFFQRFRGDSSQDSWEGEIQVSLNATRTLIEQFAANMQPSEDNAIVVIGSSASRFVSTEQDLSYHIAKGALEQLVRYYSVQLGPQKVRINAISTGAVIKKESSQFYKEGHYAHDLYQSIVPLGRMGHADDITNLANFLCSPQASFLTGQNIFLDGGLSAVWHESLALKLRPEANRS